MPWSAKAAAVCPEGNDDVACGCSGRHTPSGRGRPTSAADATKHAVSRASTAAGATAERRSRVNSQVMPHQIAPLAMVCGTPEYHESGSVTRSIGSRGAVGSAG